MKYMGSKARIAKHILPIILKDRNHGQWYVEPFVGGANVIDKVDCPRIASDQNTYLIQMWKALLHGWMPVEITKETYTHIKNNKDKHLGFAVGWAGFNCSYSGKYFGGFAGKVNTKIGTVRNYQEESIKNVLKQIVNLSGVYFHCLKYDELPIPENSIIYCDPPYKGTTKYNVDFDHDVFFNWCRKMKSLGHSVFISEYSAPDDFREVWSKEVKSSLSANGKHGSSKSSVEKLFTI